MDIIKLSVRKLVEFVFNSGDIDRTVGAVSDAEAMQEGSRIHRKLQKKAGADYQAEVSMRLIVQVDDDLAFELEGRADGVITEYHMPDMMQLIAQENNRADTDSQSDISNNTDMRSTQLSTTVYTIDEIKSTYTSLRQITEPITVHLAQAYCYAYIYALQHQLDRMDVQMTYVHITTEKIQRFRQTKTFDELSEWFEHVIEEYAVWIRWLIAWQKQRNQSIGDLRFPFEYRPGQKRFVGGVYQTLIQGKKLFALAPTGTGKTISTLFPAIKVMGEGKSSKIFYLTAKTITRTVAEETYQLLMNQGLQFKFVTITARDKICIFDEARCNPKQCERAKGHYDRVNAAVFDMITHETAMSREVIEAYAEKHCVCPFEMQLDAALWVDGLICDYNYVFDPCVYLKRFFGESFDGGPKGDYIFLVDEAHNLVERSREMYSAVLLLSKLKDVRQAVKPYNQKLTQKISKCVKYMETLKSECTQTQKLDTLGGFTMYLMRMCTDMEIFLKSKAPQEIRERVLENYLDAKTFISTYDRMDERYMIYMEKQDEGEFMVKILCVEPSADLACRTDRALSTIFFSATLLPVIYYKKMLSKTYETDYDLYTESPFKKENRLLFAAGDVSSKYTRRGRSEYERIAAYIRTIIRAKNGNYMVFFPSYTFMQDVLDVFSEKEMAKAGNGIEIVVQENAMTEEARQQFLEHFQEDTVSTVIGFCVLGGIFSEGIDLKANRLIGVIIVGTGLPQIGSERELLRGYYDDKEGCGYEYAYVYPGMNKVLQAGGRVIRTETDTGVIALLDERFHTSTYRSLFPKEWQPCQKVMLQNVEDTVNQFWENI